MARSRNIKPGFFLNDRLAKLGMACQLLFAGLWTLADREGRLEDRPLKIKAQILPYYDENVDDLLQQLHNEGFILRYEVDGERYIHIINFVKHQNPHYKEVQSEIPRPLHNVDSDLSQGQVNLESNLNQTQTEVDPTSHADSLKLIPDSGFLIADSLSKDRAAICKFYERHFPGSMTSTMMDHVNSYLEDGMEAKLILHAMDKAVQVDKRTFAYVRGILNDWLNKEILTEKAAIDEELTYQKGKKGGAPRGKPSQYEPDDPAEYGIYIDGVKV